MRAFVGVKYWGWEGNRELIYIRVSILSFTNLQALKLYDYAQKCEII